jgi:hypothetical protein
MRKLILISLAFAAGLFLDAALVGASPPEKAVYRGRLFLGGGPTTQGVVNVEVSVNRLTMDEELAGLLPDLAAGNTTRFFAKAKALPRAGTLQYLGARGLRIDFPLAFEKKTDRGRQVYLVAEVQSADPTSFLVVIGEEQVVRDHFLVVALDLDENDRGEARIHQEAKVKFSAEGEFELAGYRTTPLLVVNLHRK